MNNLITIALWFFVILFFSTVAFVIWFYIQMIVVRIKAFFAKDKSARGVTFV